MSMLGSQLSYGKAVSLPTGRSPPSAAIRRHTRHSSRLQCDAVLPRDSGDANPLRTVLRSCDNFMQKYDILSTGMGAMCVTGYCVYRGQSPEVALAITAAATIGGLVLNELFEDNNKQTW